MLSSLCHIPTPFYRTIADPQEGCAPEPNINYTPYDVFCLKTKINLYLYKKWGSEIIPHFQSLLKDNKYQLVIILEKSTPGETEGKITLSPQDHEELSHYVEYLVAKEPKVCLLFSGHFPVYSVKGQRLPSSWVTSLLKYVFIPSQLNPYVNPDGLYATLEPLNSIYNNSLSIIEGNLVGSYKDLYTAMVMDIQQQLEVFYSSGYILQAGPIASDWSLEPLDDESLVYRPTWSDSRFAPDLVVFLTERLEGATYIKYQIGDNLVLRHEIAKQLGQEVIFFGVWIKFLSSNLQETRQTISIIEKLKENISGQVITHRLSSSQEYTPPNPNMPLIDLTFPPPPREDDFPRIEKILKDEGIDDYLVYKTEQEGFPQILSIKLPLGYYLEKIKKEILLSS